MLGKDDRNEAASPDYGGGVRCVARWGRTHKAASWHVDVMDLQAATLQLKRVRRGHGRAGIKPGRHTFR